MGSRNASKQENYSLDSLMNVVSLNFAVEAYPGERLVVCRNPALAERRRLKKVQAQTALDGLYVVRSSLSAEAMNADGLVRNDKRLSKVERAFRSMKTMDLHVRPIHHRLAGRVKAHIFLCMLAYYVRWHMEHVLRPVLFNDDTIHVKRHREAVASARRSPPTGRKIAGRTTEEGLPIHSFQTLLAELSTIVRNTCRRQGAAADEGTFDMDTTPNPFQRKVFHLLSTITLPQM